MLDLKADGKAKRGEANKSDEMMAIKVDGGEGQNAEDLLNSCPCRRRSPPAA